MVVALSSSNPAAASVPATISFGPPGSPTSLDCVFVISLAPNAPEGPGDHLGHSQRAHHDRGADHPGCDQLVIRQLGQTPSRADGEGGDQHPSDTLQVFVSGTTQLIGTMTNLGNGNYQGQFPWPVNPGKVDIKSSGGATLTIPIT